MKSPDRRRSEGGLGKGGGKEGGEVGLVLYFPFSPSPPPLLLLVL